MNANDDFENKRLIEEIEKLDNDQTVATEDDAVKMKNPAIENFIFFAVIIAIVFGVMYLYSTKDNSGKLEKVDVSEYKEDGKEIFEDTKQIYQIDDDYEIDYENYETDYDKAKKAFAEQKENIVVTKNIINVDKELILCINNKNKVSIPNVYVYVVFYDGDNKIVGVEYTTIEVLMGESEKYLKLMKTPEVYERAETFITKEYFGDSIDKLLNNEITYKIKEDENGKLEEIEFKNNSDEEIDIMEVSVIYYGKNDSILDVENNYCFDIKKNKTDSINYYGIWSDLTNEKVEYERYEVKINHAIAYDNQ